MPFGAPQRARLNAWLREGAWPRNHMSMPELEGYLAALISWPVGISSGAWLPVIWGERGWKVPAKISSQDQFDEFVALVVGFMRDIDLAVSRQNSRFESSVLRTLEGRELTEGLHLWGRGFLTALTMGSQGFKGRNITAGAAVRTIASRTSASAPRAPDVEEVVTAMLVLIGQRSSRGPLGALEPTVTLGSPAPTTGA